MVTSDQIISIAAALGIGTIGPMLAKAIITRKHDDADARKAHAEADSSIVDGAMIVIESLRQEIKRLSDRVEYLDNEVTEAIAHNKELQKAFSLRLQKLEAQRATLNKQFLELDKQYRIMVVERDALLKKLEDKKSPG